MKHKDYSSKILIYEAFIDVAFLPDKSNEYSDLITMWIGDFDTIMNLVPLNEDDMFVALACHYQVDMPWRKCEDEPWQVDDIEVSLAQLLYAKDTVLKSEEFPMEDVDTIRLLQICDDMCDIFEKAKQGYGKAFIKYYY